MINFLKETIEDIRNSGHIPEDIIFIGSVSSWHQCTWDEFIILADFEYDEGFGSQFVAEDLTVVFLDGHTMTRGEYDGSEWWQHSKPFIKPKETKKITSLKGGFGYA